MAIPPPPEDSNNLSTPLERLLAMEQQKRVKEQQQSSSKATVRVPSALRGQTEASSGDVANATPADSTTATQCSSLAVPGKR